MTPREFSVDVVRQLTAAGHIAYWAGGCVRDLLLGQEPNDFDVATSATPDQVRDLFGRRRTLAVGESFGVIIVLGPQGAGQVEVATFRNEGEYLDGRRPDSVSFSTPEEDAQRRDFTVNGMFYDPISETVHDFVGGQQDLQARIVRAIGDPHDRMSEDKLRLLRAVRFAAVLDFELDAVTAAAVQEMSSEIIVVSAERIAQELKKMLVHENRATAVKLCEELDLLKVILPEVTDHTVRVELEIWQRRLELLQSLSAPSFCQAMAALLRDVPSPVRSHRTDIAEGSVRGVCRRLKLSNVETDTIDWLVHHRHRFDAYPDWSLAEKKRLLNAEHFDELFSLERHAAVIEEKSLSTFAEIDQYLARTPVERINPPEILDGRKLIELGHKPGRHFQVWLQAVRDAQLNEEISTTEEAIQLLENLAADN